MNTHTQSMTAGMVARVCVLVCAAAFFVPVLAHAAEMSFSPTSGTYSVGKDFSVKVLVNPGTDNVNAADGTVSFDKDVLSVSSVTKDGSVFSLWTADPSFSNAAGTVTFSGGTPNAFNKSGTVVTIKFKGKKAGTAKLSFTQGSVLAADGKGTNVYAKGGEAEYTIEEAAAKPPEPKAPAASEPDPEPVGEAFGGSPPIEPTVTSPTHPKPENWYGTSTVSMSWKVPPDVTSVRILFSDKDDEKPNIVKKVEEASTTYMAIADGTHYFYIQFKNEAGWGAIGKRKVLIDTVAPKSFDVGLIDADGATPKFKMKTTDELSGMDRYEMYIDGNQVGIVKDADVPEDGYPVPPQEGGVKKVLIKAYDKAGNVAQSERELTLPAVVKAAAKGGKTEEAEAPGFFTTERILLILFAFAIGVLGTVNMYNRKNVQRDKLRILEEVASVRDKNDKIFSAMREEFEQMVQDLDDKPQLTPIERDLLEKIKEVLEISEELVDTGMDELKKTVRG